jgi:hypothetical protein
MSWVGIVCKIFVMVDGRLFFFGFVKSGVYAFCRNPTLAKCGGEAQHLEKVRIWSPSGLPNVQSSTERPKTPRIEVFLVSLESS